MNGTTVDFVDSIEVRLTLRQIRGAWHPYAVRNEQSKPVVDPDITTPLGLPGEHSVEVFVGTDCFDRLAGCDYTLLPLTLSVNPTTTAWEIARVVANHFASYRVMDEFELVALHFDESPARHVSGITLFAEAGLTEDDLEHMPF